MTEVKAHPAAECVRLMDADELASLVASIKENGQRDAIVLGRVNGAETAVLVDGRNRLRACEIAGVEPRFETIEFADDDAVKAYVADKSEHRNLSKGQAAMRLALLYPQPEKLRRKGKSRVFQKLKDRAFRRRVFRKPAPCLPTRASWRLPCATGQKSSTRRWPTSRPRAMPSIPTNG